jgi:excisionase family DNA binding protein
MDASTLQGELDESTLGGNLTDVHGAAAYLGTTDRHVRRLTFEKRTTSYLIGGKRRFRLSDLDAFIRASRQEAVGAETRRVPETGGAA